MPQPCLINYNARVYDPNIARFTSADSIVPDPLNSQSFNRYSYVGNNPLNSVDPTGLKNLQNSATPATKENVWCYECGLPCYGCSGPGWTTNPDSGALETAAARGAELVLASYNNFEITNAATGQVLNMASSMQELASELYNFAASNASSNISTVANLNLPGFMGSSINFGVSSVSALENGIEGAPSYGLGRISVSGTNGRFQLAGYSGTYFKAYPSGIGFIGGGVFSEDKPLTVITDTKNGYVYKIHGVAYNMTVIGADEFGFPSPIGPADYSITNLQTDLTIQQGTFDISIGPGHDTYLTINNLPGSGSGYPVSVEFSFSQAEGGPEGGGIVTVYRVH